MIIHEILSQAKDWLKSIRFVMLPIVNMAATYDPRGNS